MAEAIRLLVRGDDAGSCESANRAILDAAENGILRNVSVMANGPFFAEAAHMLAGRENLCLGLHVTLNAEWDRVKWGPVLPLERVSSLVDENGHFLPTPRHLNERGFDADEVMAEVQAQFDHAREGGLPVAYLDEHMGVAWLPGLRQRFAAFAEREGLVYAPGHPGLPCTEGAAATNDGEERAAQWAARIAAAPPGTYLLITHPGYDAEDMRRFGHEGYGPEVVAPDRDADRRALTAPRLRDTCREHGVELIRYVDI